ncbi:MAG: RNA polymerase sigma factor [Isosphaeraceae bacterium]|nr:RNA polymerase sigma factor [Isosphaeraceae bacterium]
MTTERAHAAAKQVERLFTSGGVAGLSEGQLLDRFVARRDDAAFEALVARHGPMVLTVCRRLLRDPNDVDDAFQATFVVLARKAGSLQKRERLGNWLYGVAWRIARRSRESATRRSRHEGPAGIEVAAGVDARLSTDLYAWLHEEIGRLPEKYRAPVVSCYLEGLTHDEAAERLGWPVGTVKGRLARARDLLRSRLTRRGLTAAGAAAVLTELPREALSAIPAPLIESTLRAALGPTAGLVVAPALVLAEGVIHTMFLTKLKPIAVALFVASSLVAATTAVRGYQFAGGPAGTDRRGQSTFPKDAGKAEINPAAGAPAAAKGSSVTPTALSALSVMDVEKATFNTLLADSARLISVNDLGALHDWSLRVLQNHLDVIHDPAERLAAVSAHAERMRDLSKRVDGIAHQRDEVKAVGRTYAIEAEYRRASAQQVFLQPFRLPNAPPAYGMAGGGANSDGGMAGGGADSGGGMAGGGANSGGGMAGGGSSDDSVALAAKAEIRREIATLSARVQAENPADQAIRKKLDVPISMSFANETPLEVVLKYIKSTTQSPNDSGIPVYVDPEGLKEAQVTLQSTVTIDLEGVPLRVTLRLLLRQIGLAYCIRDGLLMIRHVRQKSR